MAQMLQSFSDPVRRKLESVRLKKDHLEEILPWLLAPGEPARIALRLCVLELVLADRNETPIIKGGKLLAQRFGVSEAYISTLRTQIDRDLVKYLNT